MSNKVLLKNLVKIDSGFAFKSSLFTEDEQYIPIIRIRDVNSGVSKTYYSGEYDENYIVNNGDLLISMDGSFIIKKWTGGKALLNQRICRIKSISDKITDDYLLRILPKELKVIEDKTPFVTVKHLSVKSIENIEINLPSLEIQNKIVEVLDKAQELIDKRKEQVDALDELVKSRFIEMFGDQKLNPKGWKKESLKDWFEVKGRVGWKGYKKEDLRESGPLVLGATHISSKGDIDLSDPVYISEEKFDESPEIIVETGDIIFVQRGNTIGKVGLVSSDIGRATINPCVLILRPNEINSIFVKVLFLLKSTIQDMWKINSGSAQPMITQKSIGEYEIIVPPIELQNQFADFVNQVDKLKSQMETSLKELEDNFNSLMQKAFKGELF